MKLIYFCTRILVGVMLGNIATMAIMNGGQLSGHIL